MTIDNNFTTAHFQTFIAAFPNAKIYTFGIDTGTARVDSLEFNMKHRIGHQSRPAYMSAANLTAAKLHEYTLVDNELQLRPISKHILLLPSTFIEHIFNELIKRGYSVLHKDSNSVRTDKTAVSLSEEFVLKISSSHID